MDTNALITCFQDTLEKSNSIPLTEKTIKAQKSNRVYDEEFYSDAPMLGHGENFSIIVEANTTFAAARQYRGLGKVVVLNFANPENPGGGVHLGAMAQEECLCRSSNLYCCLADENVYKDFYAYHRNLRNPFYSDRLIYTEGVTVFKDDSVIPQILPEAEWFTVDVITCAAPYLAKCSYTNQAALTSLFHKRIWNILEVAWEHKADVLILGAFGCGAFENPPEIVAGAFHHILCTEKYSRFFKQVVFAIKPTGEHCRNLRTFLGQFGSYASDAGEKYIFQSKLPKNRLLNIPRLLDESKLSANKGFYSWQAGNRYFGKQFSILGDSISTLEGYNPMGYEVFYNTENDTESGVYDMEDTWWGKMIDFFGGDLLVNNSWSGSRVTKLPDRDNLFPSACSDERTSFLYIGSVQPDVIIIYLGTNDWANGVPTEDETGSIDSSTVFKTAYSHMLQKLKANYPKSEIWCCTLSETFVSKLPEFTFPHKYAGIHIDNYNEIIRNVSWQNKCKLIDLYKYKMPYDSIDGSHPTNDGMSTIATAVIREMMGTEVDRFLDCPATQHDFVVSEEYTGGTRYVCRKCGKEKYASTLWSGFSLKENREKNDDSDYTFFDPEKTLMLHSDTIRLTFENSDKTVQAKKVKLDVGRHSSCDLIIDNNKIARRHATFFYERHTWFLGDNGSMNGTWLNGTRMQPKKKYQLSSNDVIDFAHVEKIIFDKVDKLMVKDNLSQKEADLFDKLISEKYKVVKRIGQGGISNIYLAIDIHTEKQWLLKVLDKEHRHSPSSIFYDSMQGAYMVTQFNHPAIPHIVDVIEDDRYVFVVREYIEGVALDSLLQKNGAQPAEKVVEWGKQLCDVLGYLHNLTPPHIYRDMKPGNIILKSDGHLKLIDFGIMHLYDPKKNVDDLMLGTVGYAAPEQGGLSQSDARTDIYALGMTMHHLVTGIHPWKFRNETKSIYEINANLPEGLDYIISKCTQHSPDDRYQSCDELLIDLNNYKNLPKRGILGKIFKRKK